MKQHRIAMPIVLSALALSACGSAGIEQEAQIDEVAETLPEVTPLAAAFARTSESTAYRAEMAMGMNMELGALGQAISFPADPATPMIFMEADADGEQHMLIDMGPMMNAMLGPDAASTMGGDLSMETWLSGSTMTMDMGGFGPLLQQTPGAAEVFPGEIFTVDVLRLGEGLGGPEVAAAIAGQAAPDPVEMVDVLRDALADAKSVDGADDRFAGQISFSDYSRAFGQDPDAMLGGMDAMFEQLGGAGGSDAFIRVFEEIVVDVDVTVTDGAVDTIRFDMDMSPIWSALPDLMAATGEEMSASDRAEFDEMFADATFEMTMLMDYDIDPTVDVVVPTGDYPDATDQFLDVFGSALTAD
jgi:hypothetical protein